MDKQILPEHSENFFNIRLATMLSLSSIDNDFWHSAPHSSLSYRTAVPVEITASQKWSAKSEWIQKNLRKLNSHSHCASLTS